VGIVVDGNLCDFARPNNFAAFKLCNSLGAAYAVYSWRAVHNIRS
jgi:hypothetical protein